MRTKGNPNVLVQVEAQLWTPTGKMPKLPPVSQQTNGPSNGLESRNIISLGSKVISICKNAFNSSFFQFSLLHSLSFLEFILGK